MLSPQSKYALRAVTYLLQQPRNNFYRVEAIAAATDLPAPYLSKVLKQLAQKGILTSKRGKNGGVALPTDGRAITFHQICCALNDPIVIAECILFKRPCNESAPCAFHTQWSATKQKLLRFLQQESLS